LRYLVLSDIHANIDALDAVLEAAQPGTWDRLILLGDLVGYGAEPNAVIDRVRGLNPVAVIRGNHDKASCGLDDGSSFNLVARTAAKWTYEALAPEHREYLRTLPQGPVAIDDSFEICHGSPFDEDYYIFDGDDAARGLDAMTRQVCLFGHTHLPVIFRRGADTFDGVMPDPSESLTLPIVTGLDYLVNVGSVGQPRDGDPRAAFGIYDADGRSLVMRRVSYPVDVAQRRILAAGLPPNLANRLAVGR
jgi:diadenosine tetraphosphatase ApaH/serine/threonine PP2A family protein phosphatase